MKTKPTKDQKMWHKTGWSNAVQEANYIIDNCFVKVLLGQIMIILILSLICDVPIRDALGVMFTFSSHLLILYSMIKYYLTK